MTAEFAGTRDCAFCAIVLGDTEATWVARPDSGTDVVCFHNQLKWARVMLLVIPTRHMTQLELWSSRTLIDAALLAVEMGEKHCGDEGFRVISNFGRVAHQSQVHGHLHVVSGTSVQIREANQKSRLSSQAEDDDLVIDEYEIAEVPFAAQVSPAGSSPLSQREMWAGDQILAASRAAIQISEQHSPDGFRLMSSFDPVPGSGSGSAAASDSSVNTSAGNNPAGLFLLGGGQLGLYV